MDMPTSSSTVTNTRCRRDATTSSWIRATCGGREILGESSSAPRRVNPGKDVSHPGHLKDPDRTAQLQCGPSGAVVAGRGRPGLDRR